ncbi:hypothetical protein MTO96_014439 [Rhipicephalus appendiculatus]
MMHPEEQPEEQAQAEQEQEQQQMEGTMHHQEPEQQDSAMETEMNEQTAQLLMAANQEGLEHLAVESENGEVIHFAIVHHPEGSQEGVAVTSEEMAMLAAGGDGAASSLARIMTMDTSSYMVSGDMTTTSAQLGSETKVVGALNTEAPLLSVGSGDLCTSREAYDVGQGETASESMAEGTESQEQAIAPEGMAYAETPATGEGDQMPIVMMVPGGSRRLEHGGSEGGNTVFALPGGLTLGGVAEGQEGSEAQQGCVTVALDPSSAANVGEDHGILTLPMVTDTMTGQVSVQFAPEPGE